MANSLPCKWAKFTTPPNPKNSHRSELGRPRESVSDKPIDLRIYSPNVPDLTLIDLPGYVQISSLDQPETLKEKIAALCDRYIREPNIILAVCAADVDLANSPALSASRKKLERRPFVGIGTYFIVQVRGGMPSKAELSSISSSTSLNSSCIFSFPSLTALDDHLNSKHQEKTGSGEIRASDRPWPVERIPTFVTTLNNMDQRHTTVGTGTLRRRFSEVLESSLASSLRAILNAVQFELEEATYQFKVKYNDRLISTDSYVAERAQAPKARFRSCTT